ncbi:hypothetical protein ACJX0J_031176, partial [Zea mays]
MTNILSKYIAQAILKNTILMHEENNLEWKIWEEHRIHGLEFLAGNMFKCHFLEKIYLGILWVHYDVYFIVLLVEYLYLMKIVALHLRAQRVLEGIERLYFNCVA